MAIRLKEVTRDDVGPLIRLKVAPGQEDFVAPNAVSLAQLHYETGGYAFAVMEADDYVGFVQVIDAHEHAFLEEGDDPDMLYIWRLMVAQGHQGRGIGRQVIAALSAWGKARGLLRFEVGCVETNSAALGFYAALGFESTGRMDGDEMILNRAI